MRRCILLFTLLLLSACGNGEAQEQQTHDDSHTLSVLAMELHVSVLRQAERAMQAAWAEEGRYFSLDLTTYRPDEWEFQLTRLQTSLMAGQGYDMFFWDGHPLGIHIASSLFTDFYELIEQNPDTNIEDFYTNILDAWAFDGGLYIFPLSFEFTYVGINASLPQVFIDRFSRNNTITIFELMEIYIDLQQAYWEEFGHLTFGSDFYLHNVIGSFIDYERRVSSLNNKDFVVYLENMRRILDMTPDEHSSLPWDYGEMMEELPNHSVFFVRRWSVEPVSAIFNPPEPTFVHYIPLADKHGRLIIEQFNRFYLFDYFDYWFYTLSPAWGSVSISAAGDGDLAWIFIQHLISAMVSHNLSHIHEDAPVHYHRHFGNHNLMTPIKRSYLRQHMMSFFYRYFEDMLTMDWARLRFYDIPFIPDERRQAYDGAIASLEVFNDMPAVVMRYLPEKFYEDILEEFLLGLTIGQQAADEIHNRVALWLIE